MRYEYVLANAVALVAVTPATAANLINDSGFEQVVTTNGGLVGFSNGQTVGGWTAVGRGYVINTNYSEGGGTRTVPAHSGLNSLNFATSDAVTNQDAESGIKQTVATLIGGTYGLSFWLGDMDGPLTPYPASIGILINGSAVSSAVYQSPVINQETWKQFSLSFTALTSATTILFLVPGSNDNFVGLDDVALDLTAPPSAASVPEPATWATMLLGFGLIGAAARRGRPLAAV